MWCPGVGLLVTGLLGQRRVAVSVTQAGCRIGTEQSIYEPLAEQRCIVGAALAAIGVRIGSEGPPTSANGKQGQIYVSGFVSVPATGLIRLGGRVFRDATSR